MLGLVYLILSVAALLFWRFDPQVFCASEACSLPGFLGRSWYLWGALFYVIAGSLCLALRKNTKVGVFVSAGAVFHMGMIVYSYLITGTICPVCWKFAAMDALLAISYCVLPQTSPSRCASYISGGPARALVVSALTLLLVNPHLPPAPARGIVTESRSAVSAVATPTPLAAEASACYLQVSDLDGKIVCLDLREKPALFFAVWCPHCGEALKDVAEIEPEKRPYLIVTYLRDGDAEAAKEKLAESGLAGVPYYLAGNPPAGVQGVPSLVWWGDEELKHVEGAEAIAGQMHVPKLLGKAEITNPPDAGAVNAKLAASIINGTILQPGEVFSFNRAVGPRTVSRGFIEGRSVFENVYGEMETLPDVGGGVCRASTALHLAILNAGLEVVERHNHGLPVSYAEQGMDAAVSYEGLDYRFKNTTGDLIKVAAKKEDGKLKIEIWNIF